MISMETWVRFGSLLETRLSKNVFTTEDAVRYTFFAALLETRNLAPDEVVLEYRHDGIAKALIDTWLPTVGAHGTLIEFKYDRDIPSGRNNPRTQKAGKIFNDLYRLGKAAHDVHKLFVYLASREMTKHFLSTRNRLQPFFELPPGSPLRIDDSFLSGRAASFMSMLSAPPNVEIRSLYARALPMDHEIRVYEIEGLPD